jgi:hypothetical protein
VRKLAEGARKFFERRSKNGTKKKNGINLFIQ